MTDFSAFHTRDRANEGIRIPLLLPDGKPTEHWLQIRSIWSDAYQGSRAEIVRMALEHGRELAEKSLSDEQKRDMRAEQDRSRRAVLASSLIAAWSNDDPLTEESAVNFLLQAPQVLREIEKIAEDDRRFFSL